MVTDWPADEKPGQGEAPVAIAGLNILIEWGPTTGAKPKRPVGRQLQGLRDLASSLHVLLSPIRSRAVVRVPGAVESTATTDASAEPEAAPDD